MKKIVIVSIAFVFALSTGFAQEKEKKDFSEILPQRGDIALGLDMANFIKTINNSITHAWTDNTVIAFRSDFFGKYFLTDRGAIRARLGIGINNSTDRIFVRDDNAWFSNPMTNDLLLEKQTVDVRKMRNTTLELGIGYECRRSLWRVQGYLGGEIFGGVNLHRVYFEYGNPMTDANPTPTTAPEYTQALPPFPTWFSIPQGVRLPYGDRPLDAKANTWFVGAAVIIGADFFICRNLSIGAEFDLQGIYSHTSEISAKTETWLLNQAYIAEEPIKPVTSGFNLVPMGRLNLMIYF